MKVAVVTSLFTERNMKIDAGQGSLALNILAIYTIALEKILY